jgi:hypothetical protein
VFLEGVKGLGARQQIYQGEKAVRVNIGADNNGLMYTNPTILSLRGSDPLVMNLVSPYIFLSSMVLAWPDTIMATTVACNKWKAPP